MVHYQGHMEAQLDFFCGARGRIVADFVLVRHNPVPGPGLTSLRRHRFQVMIQSSHAVKSNKLVCLGITGVA
jgi:hypothetical protein